MEYGRKREGNHEYLDFGIHHVAIIMDGNGRWAQARGKPRLEGHRQELRPFGWWLKKPGMRKSLSPSILFYRELATTNK